MISEATLILDFKYTLEIVYICVYLRPSEWFYWSNNRLLTLNQLHSTWITVQTLQVHMYMLTKIQCKCLNREILHIYFACMYMWPYGLFSKIQSHIYVDVCWSPYQEYRPIILALDQCSWSEAFKIRKLSVL